MRSCVLNLCFATAAAFTALSPALAANLDGAPPPFGYRNEVVVPIDIETVHIDYTFDVAARTTEAHATVRFQAGTAGMPMFDLVPEATALRLDGQDLPASDLLLMDDPTQVTRVRVLRSVVTPDVVHELEITYSLDSAQVSFGTDRVRVGFFTSDLTVGGREFFEQYGPANFEFDHIAYSFNVRVVGTAAAHEIFANGDLQQVSAQEWTINYPDYFTSSSVYFHLVETGHFAVEHYDYAGLDATIPVTVYSDSASRTHSAATSSQTILRELETTYGAIAHERVVIYVTVGGGGMEYCGATMTEASALGHELTHSWFARGVMPNSGNAGWIDEAVASWRDNGYPRARSAPNRSPVNLGGFSAYRRHTSYDSYTLGARLISEFDYLFAAQGGMRSVLRDLFAERKRTTIDVPFFASFLTRVSGQDLTAIFSRYVYGQSSLAGEVAVAPEGPLRLEGSHHPRPYTKEELRNYL